MATIKAGTYVFVEEPTITEAYNQTLNYKAHYLTAENVYATDTYNAIQLSTTVTWGGTVTFRAETEYPEIRYVGNSKRWQSLTDDSSNFFATDTTKLRTIIVETDQTVSDSFYTWFTANTTKQQLSIDITTLPGWANLSSGNHTIKIKAKGTGYTDSELSVGVVVSKAAVTYTNVTLDKVDAGGQIHGGSYVSTGYTQISNADTSKYYLIRYINASGSYATAYLYWDSASSKWKVANSQSYGFINIVDSKSSSTKIVFCGVDSYEGSWYDWQNCQCLATNVKPESSTIPETVFTENGATTQSLAYYICIKEGTLITLADRTKKPIEDITYDDKLLVWNFYKGKFDTAKPCWITKEKTAHEYNLCKFSNGAEVGFVGNGGKEGYHRIYNNEAKAFTHTGTPETPVGTTTFAEDKTYPTIVSQEIVNKSVKFYNVGTEKHFNIFANGILTSSRISNCYKIKDMKYYGEQLISDDEINEYIEAKRNY